MVNCSDFFCPCHLGMSERNPHKHVVHFIVSKFSCSPPCSLFLFLKNKRASFPCTKRSPISILIHNIHVKIHVTVEPLYNEPLQSRFTYFLEPGIRIPDSRFLEIGKPNKVAPPIQRLFFKIPIVLTVKLCKLDLY